MSHLTERDLVNFARDELGEAKKRRMLEHGRACPACADKLIEAAREHAPPPGPLRLSRANKISLAALVVALVALIVAMFWFMRQVGQPSGPQLPGPNVPEEVR